ncbi:MAG: phosphonate C-P lyase system protein PhnH [Actinomycetota bacterium]
MSLTAHARLDGDRSQRTFDVILRSLSEPGTVHTLPTEILHDDVPTTAWLALALADVDVPVHIDGPAYGPAADLVADATSAPRADIDSAWVVALETPTSTLLGRVATGDAYHPELGARVALPAESVGPVDEGAGTVVRLDGPGIKGERRVRIEGLGPDVLAALRRATAPFPAGFDTWLFTPGGQVMAISRSTHVTVEEA